MLGGGGGGLYDVNANNGGSGGGGSYGGGSPGAASPGNVVAVTNTDTPSDGAGNAGGMVHLHRVLVVVAVLVHWCIISW